MARVCGLISCAVLLLISGAFCESKFDVHQLLQMKRIGSITAHLDKIMYTSSFWNETSNVKTTSLHVISATGHGHRVLYEKEGESIANPTWVDEEWILFTKNNEKQISNIFALSLKTGEVNAISDYPVDIDNVQLSPDGKTLAFAAYVYPGKSLEETAKIDSEKAKSRANARIFDRLFIRHWSTWETGKWRHVHVVAFSDAKSTLGSARDIMPTVDGHSPSEPFGGSEEFKFSQDSKYIAFSVKAGKTQAWLVDNNVWLASVDGSSPNKCLSCSNAGRDMSPVFSPDGSTIAWLSTKSEKNEAARNRILLRNVANGGEVILTENWDRDVLSMVWSKGDVNHIFVNTYENGREKLYKINVHTGEAKLVIGEHAVEGFLIITPKESSPFIVFQMSSYQAPADLYSCELDGSHVKQLTFANDDVLSEDLPAPISWVFKNAQNEDVQAWFFKPHNFVEGKKYPLAGYFHGGPESPWSDQWSYRWNPQILAAQGFAVLAINFHGSPGWGENFTASIQKDWGGRPFEDQITGIHTALREFPFLDASRIVGLGASYGGYTMAWAQSHAPKGLFRALVMHDGIFDLKAMYYSTEELWFPEWEMDATPSSDVAMYNRWSPASYAAQWETPMLIIHGEQDFRIPYTEGISAFTNLQRRGIDSKLILFPTENHWVLEQNDSILWHEEVIGWIKKYTV